jgi:hypothetical protein
VNATKDDKHSVESYYALPGISTKKTPRYTGEHHEYLVEFGRDGNLKSVLDLPVAYHFHRVAALSNGELLALAYDRTNAVARLLLLDSNGQVVRALVVPSEMQDSPGLVQGQSGPAINRARAETSLSWWLMAPVRQSLLLYQAHSASPVLEVGVGGATREVPLEAPKGYVLDGVVPANDRWIMRYRRQGLSDSGQIDARPEAGNYVLYEVNPSDGSLKTELDTGTGPLFNIACEQDGVITAFSVSETRFGEPLLERDRRNLALMESPESCPFSRKEPLCKLAFAVHLLRFHSSLRPPISSSRVSLAVSGRWA